MRKGFTLVELMAIIIVIAVLAVIAYTQYCSVIEKNCGSEARAILSLIRYQALSYRIDKDTITGVLPADVGIGTSNDQNPSVCRPSNFFSYSIAAADPTITITAIRCTAGGKPPQGALARTLTLTSNLATLVDTWAGNGNY